MRMPVFSNYWGIRRNWSILTHKKIYKASGRQKAERERISGAKNGVNVCKCEHLFVMSQMRTTADLEAGTRVRQDLQAGGKPPWRLGYEHSPPQAGWSTYHSIFNPTTQSGKTPSSQTISHHPETPEGFAPKRPSWPADWKCFTDRTCQMQVNPF